MLDAITSADWAIVARAVHVTAVAVWIGGVWLVTVVLLPALRRRTPERWLAEFEAIEHRFAPQARIAALLVLFSGLVMMRVYDMWDRFAQAGYWWMHLMVGAWVLFGVLLFVLEPLGFHRLIHRRMAAAPDAAFRLMLRLHQVLLIVSLAAIFAAVGGAHGLF